MDGAPTIDIETAAHLLARKLRRSVDHVVGTSVVCQQASIPEFHLYVDIDSSKSRDVKDILANVPDDFYGHEVYIRHVGCPPFGEMIFRPQP